MGNFYAQYSCTEEGAALDGLSLVMVSAAVKQKRDRG